MPTQTKMAQSIVANLGNCCMDYDWECEHCPVDKACRAAIRNFIPVVPACYEAAKEYLSDPRRFLNDKTRKEPAFKRIVSRHPGRWWGELWGNLPC